MIATRARRLFDGLFRIRYRLLLINIFVVAVPLVGIGFARFYEREMLRELEDDMVHQAMVLRQALLSDPAGLRFEEREGTLEQIAKNTRTRIRLLDSHGRVAADSHRFGPPEGPEPIPPSLLRSLNTTEPAHHSVTEPLDPSTRPEVSKALAGQYGAASRVWESNDRLFLFSALPIISNQQVQGVVYVTRSTNTVRAALYRFRTTLVKILAASLGATAVLSLFLAWTISRPLSKLTRAAEGIASGDRAQQLRLDRRDEIGQLARAIDKMAHHLDARANDIRDLAADISHEFKSPLTSLRGAAELLLDGAADDPAVRARFLQNMLADTHRLDRLVSRLLELSRLQADQTPWDVFDYEAMVRDVAQRTDGVEVTYAARNTHIRGRRQHLASVIANLVDNARQYASPGSVVRVHVTDIPGGWIRTTVHNRGAVISETNLARVWDRFFTTRSDHGGTGLGLPIVASVVSAHGGTVDVRSSEQEGTVFGFDLPRR